MKVSVLKMLLVVAYICAAFGWGEFRYRQGFNDGWTLTDEYEKILVEYQASLHKQ